jgi:uncharacterized surface protein with fasciclin (FAS1) repeats
MKVIRSNLLAKLASLGVVGLGVFVTMPVWAQGVLNPNPSIFNDPQYRGKPRRSTIDVAPTQTSPEETTTPTPAEPPAVESPTTPETPTTTNPAGQDVVAVATANGSFKTLMAAVQAAGLTETLQGQGPYTIFAPTDAAFAELPQDAVQELLKPENKDVLIKILTYHVVPGQVLSADLKSGKVKSVEGGEIDVKVDPAAGVMVNDAKVLQPDVQASNGVIHVIDKVILPPDL